MLVVPKQLSQNQRSLLHVWPIDSVQVTQIGSNSMGLDQYCGS